MNIIKNGTSAELKDLLRCPHCNGQARLKSKSERVGYEEYTSYVDSIYVVCEGCGARTADFTKTSLAGFTDYTVQDFRNNPILRATVENDYKSYCNDLMQKAIDTWNMRVHNEGCAS
jgi:hypothetical protein